MKTSLLHEPLRNVARFHPRGTWGLGRRSPGCCAPRCSSSPRQRSGQLGSLPEPSSGRSPAGREHDLPQVLSPPPRPSCDSQLYPGRLRPPMQLILSVKLGTGGQNNGLHHATSRHRASAARADQIPAQARTDAPYAATNRTTYRIRATLPTGLSLVSGQSVFVSGPTGGAHGSLALNVRFPARCTPGHSFDGE
jgi:hypothetical protein